jgi:hypothetical protein
VSERAAEEGEVCTCGRPARIVFVTEYWGEVGWCGRADGGRKGPCAFCGDEAGHAGCCPSYTLRPAPAGGSPVPGARASALASTTRRRACSLIEPPAVAAPARLAPASPAGPEGP